MVNGLTCKSQWPTWEHAEILHLQTDEEATEEPVRVDSVSSHHHDFSSIMDINLFSTLQKLPRVSNYVLHFVRNCKQSDRSLRHAGQLLPADIDEISQAWIHCAQRVSFPEEVSALQSSAKNCHLPLNNPSA